MDNYTRNMSCGSCKYAIPVKTFFFKEIECHRYPPQLVMVGQEAMGIGSYKWKPAWPQVAVDNFCGEYYSKEIAPVKIVERNSETFDVKKWNMLKEVDADISGAVKEVTAVDPRLEAELAEKFMVFESKEYLKEIVSALIKNRNDELRARAEKEINRSSEKTLKEINDYEKSLGVERFDAIHNGNAVAIEPYDGSWSGWRGGIIVKFSDGRTLMKKGNMVRLFDVGDDSWR